MMVIGEVHTALLQHSHSLAERDVADLLSLVAGERVRRSTRPVSHALSPELLTGLDCEMSTRSGRTVRVIGTAVCRAAVLGGQVVQGSTFTRISTEWDQQRQPWSHYLATPGVLRPVGKARPRELAGGYLETSPQPGTVPSQRTVPPPGGVPPGCLMDLGAVSGRTVDLVQRDARLDRRPPFRTARSRLRWLADTSGDPSVTLTLVDPASRTLSVTCDGADVAAVAQFCEDVALHDWLLSTVISLVERAGIGGRPRPQVVARLEPVIDYLAHLWLPTARMAPQTLPLWRRLEDRPGFTRQWQNLLTRVRDQLTLAVLSAPWRAGEIRAGL